MSTANAKHAENRRKLTRAEKKEIAALIRAAKGDGKAHTAQQTIPYLAMYPDGICKVTEKKYSKSIAYDDINYQLAQADDKTAIFENWCDFLNYFDATVSVQLSFRGIYHAATASRHIRMTPPIKPPTMKLSATTPTVPERSKPRGISHTNIRRMPKGMPQHSHT